MTAHLRIALLKSRRLAIDISDADDGGSIHVARQIESLLAKGHEIDAFTRCDGPCLPPVHVAPNFRLWHVSFDRSDSRDLLARDLLEGQSYVRNVMACPGFAAAAFDVLLIHHWTSGVAIYDYVPESLPIIFTPHLLPTEKARANGLVVPAAVGHVERTLLARADMTVALSEAERESCLQLGARRVEKIPNGVGRQFFEIVLPSRPSQGEVLKLGSVGRICSQKSTDVLLDAVEVLVNAGIEVQLDLVGPSYAEDAFEAEITQRLSKTPLASRVRLLGVVPHSILPSVIAGWHFYLQPSRYESQGIALLEAMAAARSIVVTRLPAFLEFLDTTNAYLVPIPPTGDAVSEAIQLAMGDPLFELRLLAVRRAAGIFGLSQSASELDRLLANLVDHSRSDFNQKSWAKGAVVRDFALKAVRQFWSGPNPVGILLLGSAARGCTRPGSDLDILVLQRDPGIHSQEWRFTDGIPLDIRTVPVSRIFELCELSDEAFAESNASDPLPDYLYQSKYLTEVNWRLSNALNRLSQRRLMPVSRFLIAQRLVVNSETAFLAANEAIQDSAFADAQLRLNGGVQLLLQATLIGEGWIIQGAKRRLEIAVEFARKSESVRAAAALLTDSVGVAGMTLNRARHLVATRTRLRTEHLRCLESLDAGPEAIIAARHHAGKVSDYYSPAIKHGYMKGSINHMKALSGVPLMPLTYSSILNLSMSYPAESMLSSPDVASLVKELWLEVLAPLERQTLADSVSRGLELSNHIRHKA